MTKTRAGNCQQKMRKYSQRYTHKDLLLLSLCFISVLHIFFRGSGMKVDWFLFVDHKRNISFSVFMIGVYLRFIIMSYCLIKPKGINKNIPVFLFILSILDLIHFFTFSGLGFWKVKLLLALVCFISYVKFKK